MVYLFKKLKSTVKNCKNDRSDASLHVDHKNVYVSPGRAPWSVTKTQSPGRIILKKINLLPLPLLMHCLKDSSSPALTAYGDD